MVWENSEGKPQVATTAVMQAPSHVCGHAGFMERGLGIKQVNSNMQMKDNKNSIW